MSVRQLNKHGSFHKSPWKGLPFIETITFYSCFSSVQLNRTGLIPEWGNKYFSAARPISRQNIPPNKGKISKSYILSNLTFKRCAKSKIS